MSHEELIVQNPATGQVVANFQADTDTSVDAAVSTAVRAQREWRRTPRFERYDIFMAYAAQLDAHREELAELLCLESGKPLRQTRDEIGAATHVTRGYAERMVADEDKAYHLDTDRQRQNDLMLVRAEPLGVVAAIAAFNFPTEIGTHKMIPALATGNAVVIKPPEQDPATLTRMIGLLHEAGLPREVLQVVQGGRDVGHALASNPGIAAVSLTGSTEAGLAVNVAAAPTLKRVLLELGGNDAFIVLADADLELAVNEAIFGRIVANGQCCIANKRMIVHRDVAGAFTDLLVERVSGLVVGDQSVDGTDVGPLIDALAAERVWTQVQSTLTSGAKAVAGGRAPEQAFFEPTVLAGVTADMPIARDMEVFGPVFPVIEFDTLDDAVAVANSSKYGLSGAVFTADVTRGLAVAGALESGMVVVNGSGLYRVDATPFGGFKYSGTTREGLASSLDEYRQLKSIVLRGAVQPL